MDQEKIRKRISDAQEYIDFMERAIAAAPTEEKKTQYVTYWGFAMIIKELFELHLGPVSKMLEEINIEKQKEETVDWMTRWLKDQAKDLEKI